MQLIDQKTKKIMEGCKERAWDAGLSFDEERAMAHSDQLKIYKRRNPQTTSLWKLLNCHFVEFEECYDKLFQKKYGFYRLVISRVVRKYLECGDLNQGFARIKCPDCHHEFILAFSCRGRWFRSLVPRLPVPPVITRKWSSLAII